MTSYVGEAVLPRTINFVVNMSNGHISSSLINDPLMCVLLHVVRTMFTHTVHVLPPLPPSPLPSPLPSPPPSLPPQIVKQEWPRNWPTFISDIVGASKTSESLCTNNVVILKLLR